MKKTIYLIIGWVFSIFVAIIWAYENSDKISDLKDKLKLYTPDHEFIDKEKNLDQAIKSIKSNHFLLKVEKIVSLDGKTSFLINDSVKKKFNINEKKIFTQEGFELRKDRSKKLKLNKNFTEDYNGGLKTVFYVNKKIYGLTSSLDNDCYYAAIINLSNGYELFKSKCLPFKESYALDFNGLGSSSVHFDDKILITIGTPTSRSDFISNLAQNKNSVFGKILSIKKDNFIDEKISPKIHSLGHRNPQGITKIKDNIFSVEHGPQGGDELNKIKLNSNYGWPKVSYGTKYPYDDLGKSYSIGHENNGFEEPVFAFIPSIGISALNNCPSKLTIYYGKDCLMALSLYGNDLAPGKSIIIFLLDKNLEKIHSIEKISLDRPLRHFVTNSENEIYEDSNGDIYLASDNDGVYRVNFSNFRR